LALPIFVRQGIRTQSLGSLRSPVRYSTCVSARHPDAGFKGVTSGGKPRLPDMLEMHK
jgi:hypothetical protein